jgi:ribose transport system substrate-binding protein
MQFTGDVKKAHARRISRRRPPEQVLIAATARNPTSGLPGARPNPYAHPMRSHLLAGFAAFCLSFGIHAADLTIAVIPKGTTHEFWKSIHAGAEKARQELAASGVPVRLFWNGPLREDDRDQQIQVVENFTTRRVSGIVLAPLDFIALANPVKNASRAGIPTVIMDSDLKSDAFVSFVATDNFLGGKLAAAELARLLNDHGNVILLRYAVGSASTEAREAGFLEGVKAHPGLVVISSDQHSGATRDLAYQTSQNLLNRFGSKVDGAFCPNETATIGFTKALRDIGKAGGKTKVIGFDSGAQSVADLEHNDIQGLVVQNPVFMGYKAVMTLVEHIQGKPVEKRIDTGVKLVTPQNMHDDAIRELLHPPIDKYLSK